MANFHQFTLGGRFDTNTAGITVNTFSFVNSTDQVEMICQVPDPGDGTRTVTMTRLGYNLSSVTGTSPQMKISLQGVDASGNPDGTIKGGASPASALFTPTGANAGWNWITLDNAYTANAGDFVAVVIAYNSGTINASNRPIIVYGTLGTANQLPYGIGNVAGTRTRLANSYPVYGIGSAGKAFGFPFVSTTATAISTASESALRFLLDQNFCTTYKLVGARLQVTSPAAAKSVKMQLYSATSVIQSVTWDSDYVSANAQVRPVTLWFQDASLTTLLAGTEYRLALSPQDATNNVALHQINVASNADLEAFPGGLNWYFSSRSGGAWSDTTTSRPLVELIVSDLTPPLPFMANRGLSGGLVG